MLFLYRFAIFERLLLKMNDYFWVFNLFPFEKRKKATTKHSRDGLNTLFEIVKGLKKSHKIRLFGQKERTLTLYQNQRSYLVRVTGLEPAHLAAQEPKGNVTILEIYIRYYRQHSIVYKKLLNIL